MHILKSALHEVWLIVLGLMFFALIALFAAMASVVRDEFRRKKIRAINQRTDKKTEERSGRIR